MSQAVIYTGSHRRGGNSERVAEALVEGISRAGGDATIYHVRSYDVKPCLSCGFCDKQTTLMGQRRCVLGEKDQAWELFAPLFKAKAVFFVSPIYFYHLPSIFKTWIDRGQQFWTARMENEAWIASLPKRTAQTVFVAGQPTGEKLFDGARLTLKYFAANFRMDLAEPLAFRGIDQSGDFTASKEFKEHVIALGENTWKSTTG